MGHHSFCAVRHKQPRPEFQLATPSLISTTTTTTTEIQTDHLISARRTDLVIINKKKREPAE